MSTIVSHGADQFPLILVAVLIEGASFSVIYQFQFMHSLQPSKASLCGEVQVLLNVWILASSGNLYDSLFSVLIHLAHLQSQALTVSTHPAQKLHLLDAGHPREMSDETLGSQNRLFVVVHKVKPTANLRSCADAGVWFEAKGRWYLA